MTPRQWWLAVSEALAEMLRLSHSPSRWRISDMLTTSQWSFNWSPDGQQPVESRLVSGCKDSLKAYDINLTDLLEEEIDRRWGTVVWDVWRRAFSTQWHCRSVCDGLRSELSIWFVPPAFVDGKQVEAPDDWHRGNYPGSATTKHWMCR